jgi:hypothetical protein
MALHGGSQAGGAWMLRFENLDVWKRDTALYVVMWRYFTGFKDFGFRAMESVTSTRKKPAVGFLS